MLIQADRYFQLGSKGRLSALAATAALVLAFLPASPAQAVGSTIYVATTGTNNSAAASSCSNPDFSGATQQALSSALTASSDGDTIQLCSGIFTFSSQINIEDKEVTIQGTSSGSPTILEGQAQTRFFLLESVKNVTLKNLTFRSGTAVGGGEEVGSGGAIMIHVRSSSEFSGSTIHTITSNVFLDNEATGTYGGAIAINGGENSSATKGNDPISGKILISENLFLENHAAYDGGAIGGAFYDDGGADQSLATGVVIDSNLFAYNTTQNRSSGAVANAFANASLIDNVFYENYGTDFDFAGTFYLSGNSYLASQSSYIRCSGDFTVPVSNDNWSDLLCTTYDGSAFNGTQPWVQKTRTEVLSRTGTLAPRSPLVNQVTEANESLQIALDGARDDGGASITKYQYSFNDGLTWTDFASTDASALTISSLTNGQTYNFRIRSFNGTYYSAPSAATSGTPQALQLTVTGAPQYFLVGDSEVVTVTSAQALSTTLTATSSDTSIIEVVGSGAPNDQGEVSFTLNALAIGSATVSVSGTGYQTWQETFQVAEVEQFGATPPANTIESGLYFNANHVISLRPDGQGLIVYKGPDSETNATCDESNRCVLKAQRVDNAGAKLGSPVVISQGLRPEAWSIVGLTWNDTNQEWVAFFGNNAVAERQLLAQRIAANGSLTGEAVVVGDSAIDDRNGTTNDVSWSWITQVDAEWIASSNTYLVTIGANYESAPDQLTDFLGVLFLDSELESRDANDAWFPVSVGTTRAMDTEYSQDSDTGLIAWLRSGDRVAATIAWNQLTATKYQLGTIRVVGAKAATDTALLGGVNGAPSVAWDSTRNRFLVVWTARYASGSYGSTSDDEWETYGRFVAVNGTTSGQIFRLSDRPDVQFSNGDVFTGSHHIARSRVVYDEVGDRFFVSVHQNPHYSNLGWDGILGQVNELDATSLTYGITSALEGNPMAAQPVMAAASGVVMVAWVDMPNWSGATATVKTSLLSDTVPMSSVSVSVSRSVASVDDVVVVTGSGGSGTGPFIYTTLDSSVCGIEGQNVTGLAAGQCTVTATRLGTLNIASASAQVTITFSAPGSAIPVPSLLPVTMPRISLTMSGVTALATCIPATFSAAGLLLSYKWILNGIESGTQATLVVPLSSGKQAITCISTAVSSDSSATIAAETTVPAMSANDTAGPQVVPAVVSMPRGVRIATGFSASFAQSTIRTLIPRVTGATSVRIWVRYLANGGETVTKRLTDRRTTGKATYITVSSATLPRDTSVRVVADFRNARGQLVSRAQTLGRTK